MAMDRKQCLSLAMLAYTLISSWIWINFVSVPDDTVQIKEIHYRDTYKFQTKSRFTLPMPENSCDIHNDFIHNKLQMEWMQLDAIVHQNYSKARLSGGIFLYPRQTSLLLHLICRIQFEVATRFPTKTDLTICETGFGTGHSMALFQTVASSCQVAGSTLNVNILSFDKFDRPYQLPIWHHLNRTRDGLRFTTSNTYVKGDSCKTVPSILSSGNTTCDILHGSSLCPTDNSDLVEHSPCGVLLTSTAMNDLSDRAVYFGTNAQWRVLRQRGCISDVVCFQEDHLKTLSSDYVFARKGSNYTGKFCVAMTTGKCQKQGLSIAKNNEDLRDSHTNMYQIISRIGLRNLCPLCQIDVPF